MTFESERVSFTIQLDWLFSLFRRCVLFQVQLSSIKCSSSTFWNNSNMSLKNVAIMLDVLNLCLENQSDGDTASCIVSLNCSSHRQIITGQIDFFLFYHYKKIELDSTWALRDFVYIVQAASPAKAEEF